MSDFLLIHGMAVPVAAGGSPDVDYQERGGEVVPAFAGNLLSSVKGHARVWRVQTPALSESDARYYDAMLRSPGAAPVDGRLTGGPVLAFVRGLRMRPVARSGGERWVVEFELHEAAPRLPDGNLLRNPGFEEGGAWWQPITGASFLSDPAIAHGGSGYVEIFAPAGVARRMDYMAAASNAPRQVWSVRPGDAVTFGAWAQRVSGDGNVRCEVVALDADKGNASFAQGTNIAVDEWAYSGRSAYIIPEGKAYIYLACVIPQGGNTTGTVARFDNVYLRIRMAP